LASGRELQATFSRKPNLPAFSRQSFSERLKTLGQLRYPGQGNLLRHRIRTVAAVAFNGKDRPDVAVELNETGRSAHTAGARRTETA
jgi:hypothetical protein